MYFFPSKRPVGPSEIKTPQAVEKGDLFFYKSIYREGLFDERSNT